MSKFAILETATWKDEGFIELSNDARLLFLWAWSNPQAAISGLYQVERPDEYMASAMGHCSTSPDFDGAAATQVRIERALSELRAKPMVLFDDEQLVIWVVNRCHYSLRSKKARDIMVLEYARCPDGPLKQAFASRYYDALELDRAVYDRGAVAR